MEPFVQIQDRAADIPIDGRRAGLIDWVQSMSERDEIATLIDRFTSTLGNIEHSIRDITEERCGACTV